MSTTEETVADEAAQVAPETEQAAAEDNAAEAAPVEASSDEGKKAKPAKSDDRPRREDIPVETKLELGLAAAKEALQLLGVEVDEVNGRIDDEQIILNLGNIVAPEGTKLEGRVYESLQFILNKSVNKHANRRTRLRVEAAGFTGRRGDRVDKAAHALARKAIGMKRQMTLGPLGDEDLKQFTTQLNRTGGINVQAVGEDGGKRLVVTPTGGGGRKRRRR